LTLILKSTVSQTVLLNNVKLLNLLTCKPCLISLWENLKLIQILLISGFITQLTVTWVFNDLSLFFLVYNKICIPNDIETLHSVNKVLPNTAMDVYLGDIWDVRAVVLGVSLFAVVFGFLFMFILRYTVGCMVWAFIILYFLCLLGLAFGFW